MSTLPRRLYKYLAFSDRLLGQLCGAHVHFSDPASFNDPLDCQPIVEADVPSGELKDLLARLIERRGNLKVDEALRLLRLREQKSTERREFLAKREIESEISRIEYDATNPEIADRAEAERASLTAAIQRELKRAFEMGILCLSSKYDSPLMWSHYASQHHGVALEYDPSRLPRDKLHKVRYGESRVVRASTIGRWLTGEDAQSRSAVEQACLLTKAREWSYEQEWRLLGRVGLTWSAMPITAVIFGMRCPTVVQYAIVSAMGEAPKMKFWEITSPGPEFELKRRPVETGELLAMYPRGFVGEEFEDLGREA